MFEHRQKIFVVTGANTGVGLATARELAKLGAGVIMTARDRKKGEQALDEVRKDTGNDKVRLQMLDLADLSSIRAAIDALSDEERLDCLINNAGLASTKGGTTKDGFGLVMGVNHIGTFALTEGLMPKIVDTAQARGEARVINLSSAAHQFARNLDPKDLMPEKRGFSRDAYSESKLCNLFHVREMARRYGMQGVRAHAVHPGFVNSDFGRSSHFPGLWQLAFSLTKPFQISPEKAARTVLTAALSDDGAWNNGAYWEKEQQSQPSLPQDHEKMAKALWKETERLLAEKGVVFEERQDTVPPAGLGSPIFPNAI